LDRTRSLECESRLGDTGEIYGRYRGDIRRHRRGIGRYRQSLACSKCERVRARVRVRVRVRVGVRVRVRVRVTARVRARV